jgi:hypothetical protein
MNETTRSSTVRFLAVGLVLGVGIHILIGLYFILTPFRGTSSFENLYRTKFLIGPFFTEERIKTSAALRVRYKSHEQWSPWVDYAEQDVLGYRSSPWQYATLKRNDYLRFHIRKSYNALEPERLAFDSARQTPYFQRLNQYLVEGRITIPSVDSIQLSYRFREYEPDKKLIRETVVWNLTYNPDEVAAP